MSETTIKPTAERVYRDWDEALGRKNVEAAMALYAPIAYSSRRSSAIC